MASPANLTVERRNGSRTGLVSITGSGRSYGTVRTQSPSVGRRQPGESFNTHVIQEGDTLPGLALKYDVTVHDIQKLNRLWDSESVQSRTELKIPLVTHSQPPSPVAARRDMASQGDEAHGRLTSSLKGEYPTTLSATSAARKDKHSRISGRDDHCDGGMGEKSIASILSSADDQLRRSREFAEKLARKSASIKQAPDAYNRERLETSDSTSSDSSCHRDRSSTKRVEHIPEEVSERREELENDMFEL